MGPKSRQEGRTAVYVRHRISTHFERKCVRPSVSEYRHDHGKTVFASLSRLSVRLSTTEKGHLAFLGRNAQQDPSMRHRRMTIASS